MKSVFGKMMVTNKIMHGANYVSYREALQNI
ncbi:hypothetical protein [Peribacillus frigoritolerans]